MVFDVPLPKASLDSVSQPDCFKIGHELEYRQTPKSRVQIPRH